MIKVESIFLYFSFQISHSSQQLKQVAVVVTSFLSLCIGFVTYRKMLNGEEWTLADMVVDMLWNVFSVSPRVIALVLFASYKLYWFWGIVAAQVGFGVIISSVCSLLKQESNHQRANKIISLFKVICKGLFISMGNVFTMFVATSLFFPIYILYWIVMYIENAVMMSFWHSWSENLGLWYHDIVCSFRLCSIRSIIAHQMYPLLVL